MKRAALSVLIALYGCGSSDTTDTGVADSGTDAGTQDAAPQDTGLLDAGGGDAGDSGQTDSGDVDAGLPANLACADTPLPAAPDPLNLGVRLREFRINTPVGNASIELRQRQGDIVIGTATTSTSARSHFAIQTSSRAADVYLHTTHPGFPTFIHYTGWPLYEDENINFSMSPLDFVSEFAQQINISLDPAKGHIVMTARDCNLRVLADAMISVTGPFDAVEYVTGPNCDVLVEDLVQTTHCGMLVVVNRDPGRLTITGQLANGPSLHPQEVVVEPGALTWVTMRPIRTIP